MDKQLQKQILAMAVKDQAMRASDHWDTQIDRQNTKALKKIIIKFGWPDIFLVGKKASRGAWLIAQHADHDVKFQKQCLKLMLQKFKAGKIEPLYIPYLTDRVLVNQGKPQIYGTQFYLNKYKQLVPRPIKDKINLNKRRKKFKMESFIQYQIKLKKSGYFCKPEI